MGDGLGWGLGFFLLFPVQGVMGGGLGRFRQFWSPVQGGLPLINQEVSRVLLVGVYLEGFRIFRDFLSHSGFSVIFGLPL